LLTSYWDWWQFCTSCADTSAAVPGQCEQCTSGYNTWDSESIVQADGTLALRPYYAETSACYKGCIADEYVDAFSSINVCVSKIAAGGSCEGNNYDDRDQFCLSGLCSGDYCCSQVAADAGCMNRCDKDTGACSEKVDPGEACSDTSDCFDGKACLGGRCCTFTQQLYLLTSYWDWWQFCTSCADTSAAVPGQCEQCTSGYNTWDSESIVQADGTLALRPYYAETSACYKGCIADEYVDAFSSINVCVSKIAAGGSCEGNNYDDRDQFCLSGLCSTENNRCCDIAAAEPVDGKCCTLCASSDGSCLVREACPPCDASGDIANGIASPCTSSLAAGTSCEPTCNSGYTLTGSRSCNGQSLSDTAACNAILCDPDYYVEDNECKACVTGTTSAGGSATTCTANCDANQYWDGDSCEACPVSSTSAGGALTSCTCPANKYAAKSGSTWTCADCTAGRTKAANSAIPGTGDGETEASACGAASSCSANQYISGGVCTACPAQSTSDDAKSKYCVCDGGHYAIKTAGVWNCAACEGATGSRIPQESGEDAKCASALKAAAEKSRAALLDDIADESLKKKAQLLADAAIAGEKVKKITLKEEASDKDSACSSAFTKAGMKSTDGACVATASASSGRRRLSATTYDVELVFSSSTVSESKLSAAVNSLKANGVEVVKSESAVDPIAELENIPGVDSTKLTTFKTEAKAAADAAAAPADSSSTSPPPVPPPPPSPPPPKKLVLDEDDHAAGLTGILVALVATIFNML